MTIGRGNGKSRATLDEFIKQMGVTPEARGWIELNRESIDEQFKFYMEANRHWVLSVDLASGDDVTVYHSR
jgi:hypothetical protein